MTEHAGSGECADTGARAQDNYPLPRKLSTVVAVTQCSLPEPPRAVRWLGEGLEGCRQEGRGLSVMVTM